VKIGVLITAYDKTASDISALGQSMMEHEYYTVIGYDAHKIMPSADTVNSCDVFFSGGGWSGGGWGGKQFGELRNIRTGFELILSHGCHYALKLNGDSIIGRPEGIHELIKYLGDNDVITCQWWDQCGTMIFFGKPWPLAGIFSALDPAPPQIEKRFTTALNKHKMAYQIYPCTADDQGIWGSVIDFQRQNKNFPPISLAGKDMVI
jgi:hypothetical protein